MDISFKQINTAKVEPLHIKKVDLSKLKGKDLFNRIYCNIFICAKQRSGKTTVLHKIIKECTDKNTQLYVFCANHAKDDAWKEIKKMVEKKGMFAEYYSSLIDDETETNDLEVILQEFIKKAEEEEAKKKEKEQEENEEKEPDYVLNCQGYYDRISVKIKKKKEDRTLAPETMFIFDDLSEELKNKWIKKLLKMPTHIKGKVIISSQYLNDIEPGERQQLDYWLIFQGQPDEKLEDIYKGSLLTMGFERFQQIYKKITEEKYTFMYIDRNTGEIRKNFDQVIIY